MYQHHKDSIQNMIEYFQKNEQVIAVILGGSVAKGLERPDSDVDANVIVTPECYEQYKKERRLTETISGYCTYEGGYFDIKYDKKEFLAAVADHGSEPARNAFLGSRCLYSKDPEIESLVKKIPVFQKQEKAEKMFSFYSALMLNKGYFWSMSYENPYLRARAIADIAGFGMRMVLEEQEVLFPCHKSLTATLRRLGGEPERIADLAEEFLKQPTDEKKEAYVNAVISASHFQEPKDHSEVLTCYVADNERWWDKARPVIAEW